MTTVELTHPVVVTTDEHGSYRAECGCGWASDWYDDDDLAAELAGIDHLQVVIGPPDPLDRCLTDLLDIQDNLCQLVIWLADNWTADLPAPKLGRSCRCNDDPGLWLDVDCPTAESVAAVAALLDSSLIEHVGTGVVSTMATFGRVRLEAVYAPHSAP